MNDIIFGAVAPLYRKANLSVIPLYPRTKKPMLDEWSKFSHDLPSNELIDQWCKKHPLANIGLVCGPASNIIIIDIDTEDTTQLEAIYSVIPRNPPWKRVGKKGVALAFKYNGQRACKIMNPAGGTIVEILSTGNQVVLPPSIHPDTGLAYRANTNLYSVIDDLPSLPADVENQLRSALQARGVQLIQRGNVKLVEFISTGSRDIAVNRFSGFMSYAVIRGELTVKEAIDRMITYVSDFTERVIGDEIPVATHINNFLNYLKRDLELKGLTLPLGWDLDLDEEIITRLCIPMEHLDWGYEQYINFLHEKFELDESSGSEISSQAVDTVIAKLAKNTSLNPMKIDQIVNYIANNSNLGIRPTAINKTINKLRREVTLEGNSHYEIANAAIEDWSRVSPVAWEDGALWQWQGSHWGELTDKDIRQYIAKKYSHLDLAKRYSDISGLAKMFSDIAPKGLRTTSDNRVIVNFVNGMYVEDDEQGFKLLPHASEYGLTYTLPYKFREDLHYSGTLIFLETHCPRFYAFLHSAWHRDEDFADKVRFLQEMLCAMFFNIAHIFQKALFLQGAANSGKSQLLEIISSLLPADAQSAVSPHTWGKDYHPAEMLNKLLNIAGELSDKKRIDGEMFKQIVDGSKHNYRRIYGDPFSGRCTCLQVFAANHLPKTEDTSQGFNRRWGVLRFNYPIPADKIILNLAQKIIAEEREAIAVWAISIIRQLRNQNGYSLPKSHLATIEDMANANNSVRLYFTQNFNVPNGNIKSTEDKSKFLTHHDIFTLYFSYCLAQTIKPVREVEFKQLLLEIVAIHGLDFTNDSVLTVYGIQLSK